MAYLKLDRVGKSFGAFVALKDINLEAEAGEFVVLLGPSGCGKSTMLRLITGLIEEHEGDIYIKDKRVTDLDPKDRSVAMVFQSYALYPHLTVAKNISFGMEINHVPKGERNARVLEAAKALQLENLLHRYPSELSGGQRQRVAIGRCLVREPDLFLFDEPLSNLDAKLRNETRAELKQLHQRLKRTTVYVTHDQHEAMTLGTKVVLIKDGEIVQVGPPLEIYEQPNSRFAATFIGTPQINLFPGTLSPSAGGAHFSGEGLDVDLDQAVLNALPAGPVDAELGVRAENAAICPPEEAHCTLTLDYAEPTGADIYLNGTIAGRPAVVRIAKSASAGPGDEIPIRFDLTSAVLFDTASGARI